MKLKKYPYGTDDRITHIISDAVETLADRTEVS